MINIEIGKNESCQRLDKFLKKYLDSAPLSFVYKAVRKDVKVNGSRKKGSYFLSEGDVISLYIKDELLKEFHTEKKYRSVRRNFGIVYEDENILIVNKPSGILTHGDGQEKKNHLTNQVIDYLIETEAYIPRLEKTFTPAPVNRLDRNTSGLVIFCKNYRALQDFNMMIRDKNVIGKYYRTIVCGRVNADMELRAGMVKNERKNLVSVVSEDDEDGKTMITKVHPLEYSRFGYTLAEIQIVTGRTHQIRVQMADAGHPVAGDRKYGRPQVNRKLRNLYNLESQFLHAERLEFGNMGEGYEYLSGKVFRAPLPEDIMDVYKGLFGKK